MPTSSRSLVAAALALCAIGSAQAVPERISPTAADALARLRANTDGALLLESRAATASAMLRSTNGRPLMADGAVLPPVERARFFLSVYGAALGLADPMAQLAPQRVSTDVAGNRHVHFEQVHDGLPVFGARLVVHMNDAGITAVNGVLLRNLEGLSTTPARPLAAVRATALAYAGKLHRGKALTLDSGRWLVYPVGLVQGQVRAPRLAYEAIVSSGPAVRERVFVDARTGAPLDRFSLVHTWLNREIYTPDQSGAPVLTEASPAAPADPPLIDDPGHNGTVASDPAPGQPTDNLYVFAGGTYALYANLFGRLGYDACDGHGNCQPDQPGPAWSPVRGDDYVGQIQKSVYLINDNCPNAYWNGDSTNYCPGFDVDDVVSHEWSHAYTDYTSDLIYAYQSGALNESYSDIFGEAYDLLNKLEGPLGALSLEEHKYYEEGGSRWVVGEDLSEEGAALLLRDMWKPDDFPSPTPGSTTSGNYACGPGDGGGVHTNSGVPNHTFAMLVDGTAGQGPEGSEPAVRNAFNGQSFAGIGMVKAAHIYFQAQANYQTPSTDFSQHAAALEASCQDLKGVDLNGPDGAPSGAIITQADCDVLHQAVTATELYVGVPCPFLPVLRPGGPAICPGAATIFEEDWETGDDGWTRTSTGVFLDWEDSSRSLRDFKLTDVLPEGHSSTTAYAPNISLDEPGGGDCQPGSEDYSGQFTFDSPAINIPAGATSLQLRFHHYVATEGGWDGAQLEIKVNAGAFALVPAQRYVYNPPNLALNPTTGTSPNTNPNGGERAWSGVDINPPTGAPLTNWGTTTVDLAGLAVPGDTVQLRFTASQDGCNGIDGWYIDDVHVYSCPVLEAPELSIGPDYEDPDTDGSFTLLWTRPAGATGPDQIQTSETSCAALVEDDAEGDLSKWVVSTEGDGAQPWEPSTTKARSGDNSFWGTYTNGSDAAALGNRPASLLALKDAVTIPDDGPTNLVFWDFFGHEGDDGVFIDLSTDDGATWQKIYQANRVLGPQDAAGPLATEPLTERVVPLTDYKGQSIKVRFRFQSGGEDRPASAPLGWYVDDIAIVNDNWGDLLSTPGASQTLTGQADGSRCYRVRTTYTIEGAQYGSPFSNIAQVSVENANPPPPTGGGNGGGNSTVGDNQLGGGLPPLTLLALAALALRRRRLHG